VSMARESRWESREGDPWCGVIPFRPRSEWGLNGRCPYFPNLIHLYIPPCHSPSSPKVMVTSGDYGNLQLTDNLFMARGWGITLVPVGNYRGPVVGNNLGPNTP